MKWVMRRIRRPGAVGLRSVALAMLALAGTSSSASSLSCVDLPNLETAAVELVRGKHPLWADAALIGTIEAIDRSADPMLLRIRPAILFSGNYPVVAELGVRPDGPPDHRIFHVGSAYFLSVIAGGPDGPASFVAPCAPNFAVTDESQVQRLVTASPDADIRAAVEPAAFASTSPLPVIIVLAGALAATGLTWQGYRSRYRRRPQPE